MNALEHLATSTDPFADSPAHECHCDVARLRASVEVLMGLADDLRAAVARVRQAQTQQETDQAIGDVEAIGRQLAVARAAA